MTYKHLIALLFLTACSGANTVDKPLVAEANVEVQELTETEVRFEAAGTEVSGTLIDAGPNTPAVVFVAGSGPTDRNWESPLIPGDNGSARLLANALAENGISSVRYDKRGTGATVLPKTPLKWDDYLDEIDGAVSTLRNSPTQNDRRIYLLGHSEGAAHVLRYVSTRESEIAGVVLMNGAGRSLGDVVVSQIDKQLETAGVDATARALHAQTLTNAIKRIAAGESVDPISASEYPGVQNLVKVFMAENARPFSNEILVWDPKETIAEYNGDLLILQGDRDVQIDVELDAKVLKAAQPNAQLVIIEGGDHVMKFLDKRREQVTAQDGLVYNASDRKLANGLVGAISEFIR